jgi:tetratricopeptide (TPR) repeat protein
MVAAPAKEGITAATPIDFDSITNAGRVALAHGDKRVAAQLFEAAAALARDDDDQRLPVVPDLGRSLRAIGELRRAEELLNEVANPEGEAPERFAFLEVASLRDYMAASAGSFHDLEEASKVEPGAALDVQARTKIVQAEVNWTTGAYAAMMAPLEEAREAAENLGGAEGRSLVNSALGWEARALLLGPTPAEDGRNRCEQILEDAQASESHALEASVLAVSAGLHAMLGEFEEARRRYLESGRLGEAYALTGWLGALPLYSGPIELLAGSAPVARRKLRRGYEALEQIGDRSRRATTAAFLAHAFYEEQRDDEAKRFARKSRGLAAADDAYTQVVWRGALAKALARSEEEDRCDHALRLAQEGVERANETDSLNLQGDAFFDQAVVQRACEQDYTDSLAEARGRYEDKENGAALDRVAREFEEASA